MAEHPAAAPEDPARPAAAADGGVTEREAAVQELEGAFNRLVRQYRRMLAEQAESLSPGMSTGTMKAFMSICGAGPLTPSALAEHMLLDRAQVSRMVRDLEADGLIRRDADPQDRRSAVLSATEEGRARLEAVRGGPRGGAMRRHLTQWSLTDVRVLSRLLSRLADEREDPADPLR